MTSRTRRGIVVLVIVQALAAACGDGDFVAPPTGPGTGPSTPPPPNAEFVRGMVFDTVSRPLGGTRVEVVDGPQAGSSAIASASGEFSLTGTFDDTTRFRATKDGYVTATGTLLPACATCNPGRWINFILELVIPSINMAGRYTLTFMADPACPTLPDEARMRTYSATITPSAVRPTTAFDVDLSGSEFLEGYKAFGIGVAGDYVALWLGDFHGQPGVVERLTPDTYVALEGLAAITVGSDVPTISIPLDGTAAYCKQASAMGSFYACSASGSDHIRCTSLNHRLILTRQ